MYAGMSNAKNIIDETNVIADFRSDTLTKPSTGMRAAMADALVGDDVYNEDPNTILLEEKLADMTGMEHGLFFPTGTQSNLAALLSHCGRGDEYISGDEYHIFRDEAGGAAVLGGISPFPLPTDDRGGLTPDQVAASIKPDDSHCAVSKLLSLENTVSGRIQPLAQIKALANVAHENGLNVHLDGARIFNAAIALNQPLKIVCSDVDSISICLSKGLGAPIGSVLCGGEDFIRKAKRARKMLGGGMRQVGVLAACGLYALENNIETLAQDHANAKRLALGLSKINNLQVDPSIVDTNMVFVNPGAGHHAGLQAYLAGVGIVIGAQVPNIRFVTHMDIDEAAIDLTIKHVGDYYNQ